MRPKRGAIGETWNAIADCCDRSHRARAAVAPETDCGGARSVGAIGKEPGAAASSYAGGVRILHGADHLGLMEFQQQKVSPAVEAMVVAIPNSRLSFRKSTRPTCMT